MVTLSLLFLLLLILLLLLIATQYLHCLQYNINVDTLVSYNTYLLRNLRYYHLHLHYLYYLQYNTHIYFKDNTIT